MREAAFLKQNAESWKQFEMLLAGRNDINPDVLAELFIRLSDDVAYARTFYPDSKTTKYLNTLAAKVHQEIYRNKKEKRSRFLEFWKYEVPQAAFEARRELLASVIIFFCAMLIGVISALHDDTFARLILGDGYVNMTLENIRKGDPMAVYGKSDQLTMFFTITMNNIFVSFTVFALGLLFSLGTGYVLLQNGIMLGTFHTFLHREGFLGQSLLTVYVHGTIEILSIVVAGAAGLVLGNGILFPRTYSRVESFRRGARRGVKIIAGLIPFFIVAGFLESFVTRYTSMPVFIKLAIISISFVSVLYYFIIYPAQLQRKNPDGKFSQN